MFDFAAERRDQASHGSAKFDLETANDRRVEQ
jgi:hypothetical protein